MVFSEDIHPPIDGFEDFTPHEIKHWPSPLKREPPSWITRLKPIDKQLYDVFSSVYEALDHDLGVLAAIGLRTSFDRATDLLGIEPHLPFNQKLTALSDRKFISDTEKETLTVLVEAGNSAAHRAWTPNDDAFDTLMMIAEGFLQRNIATREAAGELKALLPPRQR